MIFVVEQKGKTMSDIKFFIPKEQTISTALEGVPVTLKGIPITYERIKDGFRFYVWTEDRDKAVEIVKEIVAKIKQEHDDPKHFVTWQTVSIIV